MSSVSVAPADAADDDAQEVPGDCAIIYGQQYHIQIASYRFQLLWREVKGTNPAAALRDLTMQGYQASLTRLRNVRSRNLSLPDTSAANSWYITRLASARAPLVVEAKNSRVYVGKGAFGQVFKTVDRSTRNYFAIKVVNLKSCDNVELGRAALHREIKILERLSHVRGQFSSPLSSFFFLVQLPSSLFVFLVSCANLTTPCQTHIIECLGSQDFHTDEPLIFMPLRQGNLASLVRGKKASHQICDKVF